MVYNGGSPTSQQALAAGVPVLGIAGNLDQYLNMRAVAAMGAGTLLRSDRLNEDGVRRAVLDLLERPAARGAAVQVAQLFQRYDMAQRFEAAVQRAVAGQG